MSSWIWRLTGLLLAASLLWGGPWILVLKTGERVEADGPPLIVNDEYIFQSPAGAERRVPADQVDREKTEDANRPAGEALPGPPAPIAAATPEAARADVLALRGWLEARRFRELTQALEKRQAAFEADVRLESALEDSFLAFASAESGWDALFEEWMKRVPNSWVPYIARACHLYQRGAAARDRSQTELMGLLFDKADRDLETALAVNPLLVVAYRQLIAMDILSGAPAGRTRGHLRRALEVCPACLEVRVEFMKSLEPRWGGSREKMREFAAEAHRHARANPALRALRGFVEYDLGREARIAGRHAEAAELHAKALAEGDHWMFHYARGVALHHLGRYRDALECLDRAIALRPYAGEPVLQRSITYAMLKDFSAARRDLAVARDLRCPAAWLADWQTWLASNAPPER
jgi:tetratricopeptide (TPR) repeat protein